MSRGPRWAKSPDRGPRGEFMSSDGEGSVTRWIADLKGGDAEAARALWGRYFDDLVRIARAKLRATRRVGADEDEEDAALSAFDSFCAGAARGQFPNLADRHDLWRLLVVIAARKARRRPIAGVDRNAEGCSGSRRETPRLDRPGRRVRPLARVRGDRRRGVRPAARSPGRRAAPPGRPLEDGRVHRRRDCRPPRMRPADGRPTARPDPQDLDSRVPLSRPSRPIDAPRSLLDASKSVRAAPDDVALAGQSDQRRLRTVRGRLAGRASARDRVGPGLGSRPRPPRAVPGAARAGARASRRTRRRSPRPDDYLGPLPRVGRPRSIRRSGSSRLPTPRADASLAPDATRARPAFTSRRPCRATPPPIRKPRSRSPSSAITSCSGDRPGGDGRGLPGPAEEPEPGGRPEDDPGRPARLRRGDGAVPARSRGGGQPRPPEHRADLRRRRAPRPALLQHEAGRRRKPGQAARRVRPRLPVRREADGDRGPRRRPRPRPGVLAPRPQAGQHPPGRPGPAPRDRLRPGQAGQGGHGPDPDRRDPRHAQLHGPRAGLRAARTA